MANLPSTEFPKVSYTRCFSRCRAEFSANWDSSAIVYVWNLPAVLPYRTHIV